MQGSTGLCFRVKGLSNKLRRGEITHKLEPKERQVIHRSQGQRGTSLKNTIQMKLLISRFQYTLVVPN